MNNRGKSSIAALALAAASVTVSLPATALVITPAGTGLGFNLTLFVDRVPASGFCCGPLGIATNNLGQVVMQDYPNGANYVFNDVDNQHFNQALSSAAFASFSYGIAITNANGTLYAGNNDAAGQLFRLNPDGSSAGVVPGTAPGIAGHGIWTNPVTGHVVTSSNNGIWDIDVSTGASTQIVNTGNAIDGVSVSTDGKVIYGAGNGRIFGWNYAGVQVYDSGFIGSPDGIGVIQGNNLLSGDLITDGNDGNVWLLDPLNPANNVIIANGGSRGDYVGVDSTNGSLFLTQTDSVYRLTCGPNCAFTTSVPEPATLVLLGLGLAGIGYGRRKRAT